MFCQTTQTSGPRTHTRTHAQHAQWSRASAHIAAVAVAAAAAADDDHEPMFDLLACVCVCVCDYCCVRMFAVVFHDDDAARSDPRRVAYQPAMYQRNCARDVCTRRTRGVIMKVLLARFRSYATASTLSHMCASAREPMCYVRRYTPSVECVCAHALQ